MGRNGFSPAGHGKGFGQHGWGGQKEAFAGAKGHDHHVHRFEGQGASHGGPDKEAGSAKAQTDSVTLSDAAIEELKFMIEEEKLAGDLYQAFYEAYGLKIFDNIGRSEDRHFDAVSDYAEKIGVDVDAFVFETPGEFSNPELQEMYDTLLAQGLDSLTGALEVGVAIEERDIVDIAAAAEAVGGTPLADIYENLLQGSYAHLDAFEGVLG